MTKEREKLRAADQKKRRAVQELQAAINLGLKQEMKKGSGESNIQENSDFADLWDDMDKLDDLLWNALKQFENDTFYTAKKLEYTYFIRGNEMFVSRKDKSITRATVTLAFHTALVIQKNGNAVTGPKKLGTFGASYLYPVFIKIGVISDQFIFNYLYGLQ